jgi:hypothetical protein
MKLKNVKSVQVQLCAIFQNLNSLPLLLCVEEFQLFQRKVVSPLDLVASTAVVVQKFLDVHV